MKRLVILLPALGLAAACHRSVNVDNASVAEVSAKTQAAGAAPAKLTPGHYTMSYAITKVEMPGLPAGAQGMMDQMKKTTTTAVCVTPEQAAKPAASMFTGQGGANCTYDHFSMTDGAIDATTTCKVGPTTATSTMKGKFASDGFHMDVTTNSKGAPGQPIGSMTMAATIDAKRTGACTGSEAS